VGQPSTCGGIYTYGDVQRAIWELIDDVPATGGLGPWSQCRVDKILAAAEANGEGFMPGCDDLIAILLAPTDGCQSLQVVITQVTLISVGAPCIPIYQDETAWGDGFDFPGKNWAMHFTYEVQEECP
jgi:hypothetical protein